ncbi:DNA repair protein RadA [Sulfobacillus acidophilus TPY]|nr:DNA repair protein RadA [Sulfobacillus acidophilus TPY]
MVEEVVTEEKRTVLSENHPKPMAEIEETRMTRIPTGLAEVDRVLGGGIVPGAFMLLGGDPGIGKSTLLLQIAALVSQSGPVLYVTAEESEAQTRIRAERLGLPIGQVYLMAEGNIDAIVAALEAEPWRLAVVDSLQTVYNPLLESAPGSVSQVRDVAARLMRVAKNGCPLFLVGHVNKEGSMRPAA